MERIERDGIAWYESPLLRTRGVMHGFGLRDVGMAAYARVLGCDPARIPATQQVHGAMVHVVDGRSSGFLIGDGFCTTTRGVMLHIRTADCLPILWYDPGSCAVGAIHAGWKGLAARVISATIATAVETLGVRRATLCAAIGPAMGPACYEVSEGVIEQLSRGGHYVASVSTPSPNPGRWMLDLSAVAIAELRDNDIAGDRVADVGLCTHCRAEEFHSYRREPELQGRQGSFIALI